MKKTLSILLALALAILLAFPAFAVEMVNESFEYAFDTLPAKYDDATYISLGELWVDGATNANHNTGGGNGNEFDYIFLKDNGKGDFVVTFSVDEKAVYDFGFLMMGWAKSVLRATNVSIDDGPSLRIEYDYEDADQYHNHYAYGLSAILDAGEHTMTFTLPDDFDDTNVKTLYFDSFFYVSEPLPAEDAPAETVEDGAATAPQTADPIIITVAVAAVSGACAVVFKKRK